MKDSITQAGSAFKAELLSQTSENITNVNNILPPTQNVKNIPQTFTFSESFWCERLAALQPLQLPFETAGEQAEPSWVISDWQPPLPKNGEEEPLRTLLQAFVIYLARLTQQTTFQIGWCVDGVNDKSADLAPVAQWSLRWSLISPGMWQRTGWMVSWPG